MLQWITDNTDLLDLVASWAMVAIWIVYLQVFLWNFRRQTRPKIVINRAAGSSLDASCFVSNMSSDAIYIESAVVEVECGEAKFTASVTDYEAEHDGRDTKSKTFQGTLAPSRYASLGKFDELIRSVLKRTGNDPHSLFPPHDAIAVTVTILADHAAESLLIGAQRKFHTVWQDNQLKLVANEAGTRQIRSRRERRRLYELYATIE